MKTEQSSQFKGIQDIVDITLQDYYTFTYNPSSNPVIKSFLPQRKLSFRIEKQSFANDKYHIMNAFALYNTNNDEIIITEKLAEMMEGIILNSEQDNDRASCMLDVAITFCAFHEMGHLLSGHCQIQKDMKMCAIEDSNESPDIDIAIYQALEIDSDTFAAKRLGEKMAALILDGRYKSVLGYNSVNDYYEDVLKGICAFFYILMYLEVVDAQKHHKHTAANEIPKGRRSNESTHPHPPAVARCNCSGKTLMEHLHYFFKIPPMEQCFMEILLSSDSLFADIELTSEQMQRKFQFLIDGTFDDAFKTAREEWYVNTHKILKPYSRIPSL